MAVRSTMFAHAALESGSRLENGSSPSEFTFSGQERTT